MVFLYIYIVILGALAVYCCIASRKATKTVDKLCDAVAASASAIKALREDYQERFNCLSEEQKCIKAQIDELNSVHNDVTEFIKAQEESEAQFAEGLASIMNYSANFGLKTDKVKSGGRMNE